jgi:phage shock protein PspC (stress-responsive transcriptional regulator)
MNADEPTPPPPSPVPAPVPGAGGPRRLVRRRDDRMVAGVCSGVADYLGVDVTIVRLVTLLGAVFSGGTFLLAYLVAWVLLPEE